jgi:CMP-2-keto-3-deoxyoctulosonic acid synthetase
MKHM